MRLEELQNVRLLFVGLFEPVKGLFVVAKAKVGVHKSTGWDIAFILTLMELRQQPERVFAPTGMGVSPDQYAGCSGAAFGKRECLFQHWNRIRGPIVGDQRKPKARERLATFSGCMASALVDSRMASS